MDFTVTNDANIDDALTIPTIKAITLCTDIRHYSIFYHSENKFIEFYVPLCEVDKDDFIKIFYKNVIEVEGYITKIDKYDDKIILELIGDDYYRNGMYFGNFRLVIKKKMISIQLKINEFNTWEDIRIIYPTYFR